MWHSTHCHASTVSSVGKSSTSILCRGSCTTDTDRYIGITHQHAALRTKVRRGSSRTQYIPSCFLIIVLHVVLTPKVKSFPYIKCFARGPRQLRVGAMGAGAHCCVSHLFWWLGSLVNMSTHIHIFLVYRNTWHRFMCEFVDKKYTNGHMMNHLVNLAQSFQPTEEQSRL